jgi:hypothetical protein
MTNQSLLDKIKSSLVSLTHFFQKEGVANRQSAQQALQENTNHYDTRLLESRTLDNAIIELLKDHGIHVNPEPIQLESVESVPTVTPQQVLSNQTIAAFTITELTELYSTTIIEHFNNTSIYERIDNLALLNNELTNRINAKVKIKHEYLDNPKIINHYSSSIKHLLYPNPDNPKMGLFILLKKIIEKQSINEITNALQLCRTQNNLFRPDPHLIQWVLQTHYQHIHSLDVVKILALFCTPVTYDKNLDAFFEYVVTLEANKKYLPKINGLTTEKSFDRERTYYEIGTTYSSSNPSSAQKYFDVIKMQNYIFNYAFIPNTTNQSSNSRGEDTLFFAEYQKEIIAIVCDGVSQSCFGDIAAKNVAHALYQEWAKLVSQQLLSRDNIKARTNEFIQTALFTAGYATASEVQAKLDNMPNSTIKELLIDANNNSGSQSTFAFCFTFEQSIIFAWMGNTRIMFRGNELDQQINDTDSRFSNDKIRFSSHIDILQKSGGMRGEPHIEVIDLKNCSNWKVIIHSDALEESKTLFYQQPTSYNANGNLSYENICWDASEQDDTTLLEIFYQAT